MEKDEQETPQKKVSSPAFWSKILEKGIKSVDKCITVGVIGSKNNKLLRPRSPNSSGNNIGIRSGSFASSSTTSSNAVGCSSSLHLFSQSSSVSVTGTPPAKRFQRIRNPFEAALAERLHLPLIGSPSLFQLPATPQLSSTQFEWTIDEVSSLKPAHVEPHETQFHDSPDPDYEAKAQSAISSYFKEQLIVPSPVDRRQHGNPILLSEMNGNTPISIPGRRIRDCGTQTALTLPPVLPRDLEEALGPYFRPDLTVDENYLEHSRTKRLLRDSTKSADNRDVSLRRKLFDIHNIIVLDGEQKLCPRDSDSNSDKSTGQKQSNSSPLSLNAPQHIAIVGTLSDSLDKSTFGSLSPISATDGLSLSSHSPHLQEEDSAVNGSVKKHKRRMRKFLLEEVEQLSPIHPPVRRVLGRQKPHAQGNYRTQADTPMGRNSVDSSASSTARNELGDKFTPDRSSSPMPNSRGELSIDSSFNYKVSRLVVHSYKCSSADTKARSKLFCNANETDMDAFTQNETVDLLDGEDDDLQVSQLSGQSSNCSTSNSDTPRSRRRSASRKNLSQSFSTNWLDEAEQDELQDNVSLMVQEQLLLPKLNVRLLQEPSASTTTSCTNFVSQRSTEARDTFYRIDSGFNEMTTSSTCFSTQQQQSSSPKRDMEDPDVSMVCCSTPSKCGSGDTCEAAC